MPIYEPFIKRQRRLRGEFPDVFQTEEMPEQLREQINHILRDGIGSVGGDHGGKIYNLIEGVLIRELGLPKSPNRYITNWLSSSQNAEIILSIVEMALRIRKRFVEQARLDSERIYNSYNELASSTEEMVDELNIRFRENGYGYQIENLTIIPIDSTYTHSEAVKPSISLLIDQNFTGPLDEFMRAFAAYKSGNFKECLRECSNCIESTLKQIFAENKWVMPKKHTASFLVNSAKENGLFPSYMMAQFNALISTVSDGVPTLGNQAARHGQGPTPVELPDYVTRYAINLTASTVLFLIHAHQDYQRAHPETP